MEKIFLILFFNLSLHLVSGQIKSGDSLLATGNYDRAIVAYKNADESAVKYFKIAQVYQQLGVISKASTAYSDGFKKDSLSLRPRFQYGKMLLDSQQTVPAINVFLKLVDDQPENASYNYFLGKAYDGIDNAQNAIKSYRKAIALNPDYRNAHLGVVKNLIRLKQYVKAIAYSDDFLKNNPIDTKMLSFNAQAALKAKWYDKALKSFEALITLGKTTDFNIRNIATCYLKETKYEKAIEYLDQYIQMYDDSNSGVYFQKSVALMRLERYDESIDAMNRSIAIKRPALDQEYLQLAAIHARKNDLANAFKSLQLAQRENPEDPLIAYQLTVAADRYFADKNTIINYYQQFIDQHGATSTYGELASARLSDLKKDVFMNGAQKN